MATITLTITANSTNGRTVSDYTSGTYTYDNVIGGDNITIDWGDNTSEESYVGSLNHTYAQDGTYTVTITGVTRLKSYFLRNCKPLTGITLSGDITIGGYVLSATNITEIEIPVGITFIDGYFCSQCTNLTKVVLPRTLTTIKRNCFQYCTSLKEITIPLKVSTIEDDFLKSSTGIEKVYFENSVCPTIGTGFLGGDTIEQTPKNYRLYVPNLSNYITASNTPSDTSKYEQYTVAYSIGLAYDLFKKILEEHLYETVTDYNFNNQTGDGLLSLIEKLRGL